MFAATVIGEWTDERLKWSPEEYCGIDHLYLGMKEIWIPEVTITESVQDFPFDEQTCSIKLMSQSYSPREYGLKATFYPGNGEWRIDNISIIVSPVDDMTIFEMTSYVFSMKRNPSFYISMIITPSFIINVLSLIGVFLKTADSMGKLGIALTNVMSLTFILGILATALPKTEALPRI
ncbi:hypothetical protein OSTOST_17819, partial [Ostertagia ostertagi]